MRRNLGEPKTSVEFETIDEDVEFSKLWNMEHPTTTHDWSEDDDHYEVEPTQTTTTVPKILGAFHEAMKDKYRKGASIVEEWVLKVVV